MGGPPVNDIDWGYITNALAWLTGGGILGYVLGRSRAASTEAHEALEKVNRLTNEDKHGGDSSEGP